MWRWKTGDWGGGRGILCPTAKFLQLPAESFLFPGCFFARAIPRAPIFNEDHIPRTEVYHPAWPSEWGTAVWPGFQSLPGHEITWGHTPDSPLSWRFCGSLFASGCGISDVTSPLGTHGSGKISKQSCVGLLGRLRDSGYGWHTVCQSDHSMEPLQQGKRVCLFCSLCSKMNLVWRLI